MVLAVLIVLPISLPASADTDEPWIFDGGGWGHGVGLSQYGSQGMAVDGHSAEEIIDFYFSGAQVKAMETVDDYESWLSDPEAIWVGLSKSKTSASFEAIGGAIDVCVRGVGSDDCTVPDITLADGETLTVTLVDSSNPIRCELAVDLGTPIEGDCWVDITWTEDVANRRLKYGSLQYARGSMRVRPDDYSYDDADAFHVSLSIGLEEYIYGIAETLLHWEPETLETQAIIARSYGVRRALDSADPSGDLWNSRKSYCWCHIGSTASDQNYDAWSGGLGTEGDSTYGIKWRVAVNATASQIVTHPEVDGGEDILSTFYSSSNGGASENNEDVWGGAALPYLRSVVDPWSADSGVNPLANWTVLVSDEDMATALGWDYAVDANVLEGPPGVLVKFTGKNNGSNVSKTLNGTQVRSILNTYGYKNGGGSVRVSPYIIAVNDPAGFDDTVGTIFENAIDWLRDEGITLGCNPPANTNFCPDDDVTRGEMGIFISRALNLPVPSDDYFVDDDGKFWEGGANRMFESGISVGCGDAKYCGHKDLPREQMAVFLVRALDLPPTEVDYFTDDDGSPFEDHINRIAEAKITLGCNPPANDHFCPDRTVTRGQMAAFFKRAWGP